MILISIQDLVEAVGLVGRKEQIMKKIRWGSYLKVIFGNFIYALCVKLVVLPYDVLSGGCAGLALILNKLFNVDVTITLDILIIACFLLGLIFLGKEFSMKTLLSSIVYPVFITILSPLDLYIEADPILMAVAGGAIAGIGLCVVLREDASTGGTDIPSIIVSNLLNIPVGYVLFFFDGVIALLGVVAFSVEKVLLGIVFIYTCNAIINKFIIPKNQSAVSLFIISKCKDEICQYIHDELSRGTTIIRAKGGYTNEDKDVILTVIEKNQYRQLEKQLEKIDKHAFVIISDAKEIKGEGFTYEYRV